MTQRSTEDRPEQVVAGLSQDAVSITTSFSGSEILIYGAVKRQAPLPDGPGIGVIVTVEGPSQAVTVRHKERRGGIWINTSGLRIGAAPDFYAVASSGRLAAMLTPEEDARYRITLRHAVRAFAGPIGVQDATPYTEALLRLRQAQGRYRIDDGKVRVIDQTLFRADVALPSNLVEGTYRTRIFLLRNGRVVDSQTAPIVVEKVGLERWLFRLATHNPALYGLMSLGIAVFAGWGASALFRALRRG